MQEALSPVYGEDKVMLRYRVCDLLWRPAGELVRFVAVIYPTRGPLLLMRTDLSLDVTSFRAAVDWVGKGGRMRILRGAAVTAEDYPMGAVVCVQAKDVKQAWCLATSLGDENARGC
jgi:hypothetical protein